MADKEEKKEENTNEKEEGDQKSENDNNKMEETGDLKGKSNDEKEKEPSRRERRDSSNKSKGKSLLRSAINFKVGTKIEAMDYLKKWYPSKIVCVDDEESEVLIHFEGWNQRYDEWVPFDSERIRPIIRTSSRKERSRTAQAAVTYKAGEEVYARWTDCKYYPAKVLSANPNGSYEVYFYDGFKKVVQPTNLKELPQHLKSQDLFSDMPSEIENEIERPRSATPKKRLGSKDFNQGKKTKLSRSETKKESGTRKRGATPVSFQAKKARLDQITGKLASKVSTSPSSSSTTSSTTSSASSTSSSTISASSRSETRSKSESKSKGETKSYRNKSDRLDQITGKLAHKAQAKQVVNEDENETQPEKSEKTEKADLWVQQQQQQQQQYLDNTQPLLQRLYQEQQQHCQLQSQKQGSVIASLLTQRTYPPSSGTSSSLSGEGLYPPLPPPLASHPAYHIPHPSGMYGPLTSSGSMCLQSPPHSPYGSHYPIMPQSLSPTGPLSGYHQHLSPTVLPPHLIPPIPHHHMMLDVGPHHFGMGIPGLHDSPPDTPQYQSALMRMLQATSAGQTSTTSSLGISAHSPTKAIPQFSPTKSDNLVTSSQALAAASAVPLQPMTTKPTKGSRQRSASASQLHVAAELALELAEGRIRSKDKAKVIAHKETTIAPKELVIDLDHKKFKCDVQGCDKAFRKQSGLEYHKKYYHSTKSKSRHQSAGSASSTSRQSHPPSKSSRRLSNSKKRLSTSSVTSTRSSSSSSPPSPSVTISTDTVSITTTTTTTSSATLTTTATETVATATASIKSASLSTKSSHQRPSRLDRKKRSSAPASLPAAQEQIIKTPVSVQPPENVESIPEEVNEPEMKMDIKEETEMKQASTSTTPTATPGTQEGAKNEADISVETIEDPLSREEIVHCVCNLDEEDGFMIQCETCLCWQHSMCVGLTENTVPKKYICSYCKNPAGQRSRAKYKYDQEWLKTGELPSYSCVSENYSKSMAPSIVATHDLVGDMHVITDILHGLQQKLHILQTPNHPMLHKWLKPWNAKDEVTNTETENKECESMEVESSDCKIEPGTSQTVTSQAEDDKTDVIQTKDVVKNTNTDDVTDRTKSSDVTESAKSDDVTQSAKSDDVTKRESSSNKIEGNVSSESNINSLNQVTTEQNTRGNVDMTSDKQVIDSKESAKNIGESSEKELCDGESKDKLEETRERVLEDAGESTETASESEMQSCTDHEEPKSEQISREGASESISENRSSMDTEAEVKVDDTAMETEESKVEEDLEDMEVDVVNDDIEENAKELEKSENTNSAKVQDVDMKQETERHTEVNQTVSKVCDLQEAPDNTTCESQGNESKVQLMKCDTDSREKAVESTSSTEVACKDAGNVEQKISEASTSQEQPSTVKQEVSRSEEPTSLVSCEKTEDKNTATGKKVDIGECSQKSEKEEGGKQMNETSKDVLGSAGNGQVMGNDGGKAIMEDGKKEAANTGDNQSKLTPSSVKLTGNGVWTPVGKAKGTSRKRTESMKSERSEVSEVDVIEELEPLPPLVCEWNLLQHVSELESELDKRMDLIEQEIVALEATHGCPVTSPDVSTDVPHIKRNLRRILHDLTKVQQLVAR